MSRAERPSRKVSTRGLIRASARGPRRANPCLSDLDDPLRTARQDEQQQSACSRSRREQHDAIAGLLVEDDERDPEGHDGDHDEVQDALDRDERKACGGRGRADSREVPSLHELADPRWQHGIAEIAGEHGAGRLRPTIDVERRSNRPRPPNQREEGDRAKQVDPREDAQVDLLGLQEDLFRIDIPKQQHQEPDRHGRGQNNRAPTAPRNRFRHAFPPAHKGSQPPPNPQQKGTVPSFLEGKKALAPRMRSGPSRVPRMIWAKLARFSW